VAPSDVHRTIDAIWRIESPRLVAHLARVVRDVGIAEDLAQDALVAALEQWPREGMPRNPAAWLTAAARHRAIDHWRRTRRIGDKHAAMARALEEDQLRSPDPSAGIDDDMSDDLLRLIFTACHPVLPTEARVALTLRLLGGLTIPEIARAFLAAEPTIQQRIVRAKRTLASARVPFQVPGGGDRAARLSSVLEVIYLIFNEGYTATSGRDWTRPALCDEALRLGRMLAELMPDEAEVHGLAALMEIQASRLKARVGPGGEPVLLLDQDRARWDQLLIRRGFTALARAERAGAVIPANAGPYTLQAAIAACHARASSSAATDWTRVAVLYAALARAAPSPVVELNRAVAVSMAFGPALGLQMVDAIAQSAALKSYYLLPAVRGDLLAKLGRSDEAKREFARAASLTANERERGVLLARAAELA
jgi:RNA polymerase sigma factor (sigma-70 family)